jgi:hypothetical protein
LLENSSFSNNKEIPVSKKSKVISFENTKDENEVENDDDDDDDDDGTTSF